MKEVEEDQSKESIASLFFFFLLLLLLVCQRRSLSSNGRGSSQTRFDLPAGGKESSKEADAPVCLARMSIAFE